MTHHHGFYRITTRVPWRGVFRLGVCVPFIVNQALASSGGSRQAEVSYSRGLWAIPATQAWPPTTRDDLQPIVSCVELPLGSPKSATRGMCVGMG